MNRIEELREYVDEIILNMTDFGERRCAYVHLYGVAQACALIAQKRGENAELATMTGMLHDIYSYSAIDKNDHAHKGAVWAREILTQLQITSKEETDIICTAIFNHSNKDETHSTFNEILIDADVLQHCLYHPTFDIMSHEKSRYERIITEFGM